MKRKRIYSTILFVFLFYMYVGQAQAQIQSLYNDIQAHNVGDVITVILAENISGSSSANASTDSKTAGGAKSSISSNIFPFDPVFGAGATVKYNSNENISAAQQQLLHGTFSVRIKEVKKNGSYLISGHRVTEINGERYKMFLKGFVRPSDILPSNRVLSYRIADAKIKYLKKESIATKRRHPGFIRKVLWGLLGIATAAAAFMLGK